MVAQGWWWHRDQMWRSARLQFACRDLPVHTECAFVSMIQGRWSWGGLWHRDSGGDVVSPIHGTNALTFFSSYFFLKPHFSQVSASIPPRTPLSSRSPRLPGTEGCLFPDLRSASATWSLCPECFLLLASRTQHFPVYLSFFGLFCWLLFHISILRALLVPIYTHLRCDLIQSHGLKIK